MITETLQNSILEIIAILLITSFLVWLLTWLFTRWNWKRQLKAEQEAHQEATTVLAKTLEDKNEYVKLFEDKQEDYNGLFGDKEALEVTNQEMRQDFEVLLKEKNALFFNFKQLKADNESQSETISELLVVKNDYGVLLEDYESQQQQTNKLQVYYNQLKDERENLTAELTKERFENQNANKLVGELKTEVSEVRNTKASDNDAFLKLKMDYESDMRYLKEQLTEERNNKRKLQVRLQEKEKQLFAQTQKANVSANKTSENQAFKQEAESYKLQINQLNKQLEKTQQAQSLLTQNAKADTRLLAELKNSKKRYNDLLLKYEELETAQQANSLLSEDSEINGDEKLLAKLESTKSRYNDLLKKYEQLETEQKTNSSLSQDAADEKFLAKLESSKNRYNDLLKKYELLETEQKKADDKLSTFAKRQANYDSLKNDVNVLQQKARNVEALNAKMSDLERLNKNLERKLAAAKAEVDNQTSFSGEALDDKAMASQFKDLQRKNNLLKEHNYQLSIDLDEVNKKMGNYQGELSALSRFKNDYQRLLDKSSTWQDEHIHLQKQMTELKEENAQFQDSINNLSVFRSKYKEVVRQNEQLGLQLHKSHQSIVAKDSSLLNLQTQTSQIKDLERQVTDLNKEFQERNKHIAELQQRLSHAVTQKQNLQQQLDKTQKEREKLANQQTVLLDEDAILYEISERSHLIDFSKIGLARATEKEDLKKIKGIGEFIERKLNALGIYRFEQIAKFTEVEMNAITKAIDFFPGRIQRDKWVKQAKSFQKK